MITFICEHCGTDLEMRDELAGTTDSCPRCGQPLAIPQGNGPTLADRRSKPRTLAADGNHPENAEPPLSADQESRFDPAWPTLFGSNEDGETTRTSQKQRPNRPKPEHYEFLAPPQQPDEIGRLGPYRVLEALAAGGMGVVFRAEDPGLQRQVALKTMQPSLSINPYFKERFLREARAAAALKHPNIVTIYQVGDDRSTPFLAMEFLEGEALDARLAREHRLPILEAIRIAREVAVGLTAAHAKGLVHRDVKPSNIWLEGEKGHVKILDFGVARAAGELPQLTPAGAIIGTPAYMAPEQARSEGTQVDGRSDLFSLGCVLYRMSTGSMPFKGADAIEIISALALHTPPSPLSLNPQMPPVLSDLIMWMLAKKPENRPATAQVVVDCLEKLASARTGPASEMVLAKECEASPSPTPVLDSTAEENVAPESVIDLISLERSTAPPSHQQRPGRLRRLILAGMLLASIVALLAYAITIRKGENSVPQTIAAVEVDSKLDAPKTPPDPKSMPENENPPEAPALRKVWEIAEYAHTECLQFTPDGARIIYTVGSPSELRILNAQDHNVVDRFTLAGKGTSVTSVSVCTNDLVIINDMVSKKPLAWDCRTRSVRATLALPNCESQRLPIDRRGNKVLVPDQKGAIQLISLDSGLSEAGPPIEPASPITSLSCTPDGQSIVAVCQNRNIMVKHADKNAFNVMSPNSDFTKVRISPNGRYVACYFGQNNVAIWRAQTNNFFRFLDGHQKHVIAAEFTPDSEHLVTVSSDRTMRLWNLESGSYLCQSELGGVGVALDISPNGEFAVISSRVPGDKRIVTIQLWRLPAGQPR